MRALILRRVGLIESRRGRPGADRPGRSAPTWSACKAFSPGTACPHQVLDPAGDPEAAALLERYAPGPADLPLVVCPDGIVLENPGEADAGPRPRHDSRGCSGPDVRRGVVGAGPAGLRHGGLRRLRGPVRDRLRCARVRRPGRRRARASRTISASPTGISGQALAGRAFVQAQKFGAEIVDPESESSRLDCDAHAPCAVELADGRRARARTVVVACGRALPPAARSRISRTFEGRGVWYWASPDRGAAVPTAGGRAGRRRQFRGPGGRVPVRRRREGLDAGARCAGWQTSMSRYLIDRIEATPNIELLTAHGDRRSDRHDGIASGWGPLAPRPRRERRPSCRSAMSSCSWGRSRRRAGFASAAWPSTLKGSCERDRPIRAGRPLSHGVECPGRVRGGRRPLGLGEAGRRGDRRRRCRGPAASHRARRRTDRGALTIGQAARGRRARRPSSRRCPPQARYVFNPSNARRGWATSHRPHDQARHRGESSSAVSSARVDFAECPSTTW